MSLAHLQCACNRRQVESVRRAPPCLFGLCAGVRSFCLATDCDTKTASRSRKEPVVTDRRGSTEPRGRKEVHRSASGVPGHVCLAWMGGTGGREEKNWPHVGPTLASFRVLSDTCHTPSCFTSREQEKRERRRTGPDNQTLRDPVIEFQIVPCVCKKTVQTSPR
ncbi:hypothetical protein Bbelb_181610 [Branchiostoma belcheri]|nr:hypothetical protein Bbelb_181610 [Branchiostoma belcheri]